MEMPMVLRVIPITPLIRLDLYAISHIKYYSIEIQSRIPPHK
jgi:hypothetical protein